MVRTHGRKKMRMAATGRRVLDVVITGIQIAVHENLYARVARLNSIVAARPWV